MVKCNCVYIGLRFSTARRTSVGLFPLLFQFAVMLVYGFCLLRWFSFVLNLLCLYSLESNYFREFAMTWECILHFCLFLVWLEGVLERIIRIWSNGTEPLLFHHTMAYWILWCLNWIATNHIQFAGALCSCFILLNDTIFLRIELQSFTQCLDNAAHNFYSDYTHQSSEHDPSFSSAHDNSHPHFMSRIIITPMPTI